MFFDPLYMMMIAPTFILSLVAQGWVKSAFAKYGKIANRRGMTGAEAARRILDASNLSQVRIEPAKGHLSDHYDPRTKVLRLSPDVYSRPSLAAVGVAAHEAGHALQDAKEYVPLKIRSALAPFWRTPFSTFLRKLEARAGTQRRKLGFTSWMFTGMFRRVSMRDFPGWTAASFAPRSMMM